MAATFDLENLDPNRGDGFRDEAANLFTHRYGRPMRELRSNGKKVDIYFKRNEFGKDVRYYVEAKQYKHPLGRDAVNRIWGDYEGILRRNAPAVLILITQNGLTADAQAYVHDEKPEMRHQTIWEVEQGILPLSDYLRELTNLHAEDGLNDYYVPTKAAPVIYDGRDALGFSQTGLSSLLFDQILAWLESTDAAPAAILGGYGMGKTSFAKMLVSHMARRALADHRARRPIFIRLGTLTRYSSLEGLLGGMFSYENPVDGFNVRTMLSFNQRGRLFFVLDGFDEMKHAMSWSDFRYQIASLNGLVSDQSKVLLLGRPSAFLTRDERLYILRGLKRHGNDFRRLPNWPVFKEYEIAEFDRPERSRFVRAYLAYARKSSGSHNSDPDYLEQRACEVDILADAEPAIFNKPVHAKILVDLASDDKVDLSQFRNGISKWALYEAFFSALVEREVLKEARRQIGDDDRLAFQEELAFWLWTKQSGVTSFNSDDIPDDILDRFPDGDAADLDAKKREYLAGAAVESKQDGVYFFGHRSFAEFLVARRLYRNPPSAKDHAVYAELLTEPIVSFLREAPDQTRFRGWSVTLDKANGCLPLRYLRWLADHHHGARNLVRSLPQTSIWRHVIDTSVMDKPESDEMARRISKLLRSPDSLRFAMGYRLLSESRVSHQQDTAAWLTASIFHRLLSRARRSQSRTWLINKEEAELLTLAHKVFPNLGGVGDPLEFKGQQLAAHVERILREQDVDITIGRVGAYVSQSIPIVALKPYISRDILERLQDLRYSRDPWRNVQLV